MSIGKIQMLDGLVSTHWLKRTQMTSFPCFSVLPGQISGGLAQQGPLRRQVHPEQVRQHLGNKFQSSRGKILHKNSYDVVEACYHKR